MTTKTTSYQKRVMEITGLKNKLSNAEEFERMFKNYIRAVNNNRTIEKQSIEKWFAKHTVKYTEEIQDMIKEEQ